MNHKNLKQMLTLAKSNANDILNIQSNLMSSFSKIS